MKQIVLELSKDSCNKALKELEKYQKEIKPKMLEVCKRLAEIGAQEAQRFFDMAENGNQGVRVTINKIENGWSIVASGKSVYFVEFGTGDAVTNSHGFQVSVPIYPGSYSETHAQQYSVKGYWYYGGERLTETPIYAPMYHADRKMREEASRVLREVFNE